MEALQNFAYNSCWYATFTGVLAWELLAAKKKENEKQHDAILIEQETEGEGKQETELVIPVDLVGRIEAKRSQSPIPTPPCPPTPRCTPTVSPTRTPNLTKPKKLATPASPFFEEEVTLNFVNAACPTTPMRASTESSPEASTTTTTTTSLPKKRRMTAILSKIAAEGKTGLKPTLSGHALHPSIDLTSTTTTTTTTPEGTTDTDSTSARAHLPQGQLSMLAVPTLASTEQIQETKTAAPTSTTSASTTIPEKKKQKKKKKKKKKQAPAV